MEGDGACRLLPDRSKTPWELRHSVLFFEGPNLFGTSAEDHKKEKFRKEREEIMNATEHLFKKKHGKAGRAKEAAAQNQLTESIDPGDIVKPMFDITWGPLIGALSQVLECSSGERSIAVCLNGFVYAIRIAAHSGMSLACCTWGPVVQFISCVDCIWTTATMNLKKQDDPDKELTPIQKHNRNANVDDFVELCRASLAFVQTNHNTSPVPIGLSMRALCHTACYADLITDKRVMPPVSDNPSTTPSSPGYTYEGLEGQEALDMVLWRTLLDGLADGLKSTRPSNAGGVGCLVQRGSVLLLRAILLRHGPSFSTKQWKAILTQSLLPAIQAAAESDGSPVIAITSESPSISSVDFMAERQAPPPAHNDAGLTKFAQQEAADADSAPSRPLGEAELLVEASFTDMRHGGDGNLSRAYEVAKNDMHAVASEQPFPDSWVATTGPIALGMLPDLPTQECKEVLSSRIGTGGGEAGKSTIINSDV